MYVCMYLCMHACMYVCMCVCVYTCMHAYMYTCMYVSMHICMYACMCVCIHAFMYVLCTHVCMYVCMHACMHACFKSSIRATSDANHKSCSTIHVTDPNFGSGYSQHESTKSDKIQNPRGHICAHTIWGCTPSLTAGCPCLRASLPSVRS